MKFINRLDNIAAALEASSIVRIFDSFGKLAILVAIVTWVVAFLPHSIEQRNNERKLLLWKFIHAAQGSTAEGGRINVIDELISRGESLDGLDLSRAMLFRIEPAVSSRIPFMSRDVQYIGLNVQSASLLRANFNHSGLWWADFSKAALWHSTFHCADLTGAVFKDSFIEEVDFRFSKGLTCEQLKMGEGWENSYRDELLSCEAEIPDFRDSEMKKRDFDLEPIKCDVRD